MNATIYCRIREAITRHQVVSTSMHRLNRKAMATLTSKAGLGDVFVDGLVSNFGNWQQQFTMSGVNFKDRTFKGCLRASTLSLRRPQPMCGSMNFCISSLIHGPWPKNFSSSSACCSGAAHDFSIECSTPNVQLSNSDQTCGQALTMSSGSCNLPHPDKEETGGEDAHFICANEQAIGVADGVGGWADVGVNAGLFAQELIANSVRAIQEEPKGSVNPVRVLEKAHLSTKAKGSSTACIIALTDKGLHAINLGDSGFIVLRGGSTVFRSPPQQHSFNLTYQLESGSGGDLPSSGEVFTIPVASGDVVIAGTDGLFDNLYKNEIIGVVVNAVRARLNPQATAQKLAALARQRALDKKRQTPFASAAQEAGRLFHGGKLDDITVVVSYIT